MLDSTGQACARETWQTQRLTLPASQEAGFTIKEANLLHQIIPKDLDMCEDIAGALALQRLTKIFKEYVEENGAHAGIALVFGEDQNPVAQLVIGTPEFLHQRTKVENLLQLAQDSIPEDFNKNEDDPPISEVQCVSYYEAKMFIVIAYFILHVVGDTIMCAVPLGECEPGDNQTTVAYFNVRIHAMGGVCGDCGETENRHMPTCIGRVCPIHNKRLTECFCHFNPTEKIPGEGWVFIEPFEIEGFSDKVDGGWFPPLTEKEVAEGYTFPE